MSVDCPICLESLSLSPSTPIGVCAPCGHPFHPDCFKKWEVANVASSLERSYGQERRAKCPSCNVRVDSFASNVFLGLSSAGGVGNGCGGADDSDDDDDSLSSCDSTGDEGDPFEDGEEKAGDGRADGENDARSDGASEAETDRPAEAVAANDGGDSPDVICIDDDDDDDVDENASLSRAVSLSPGGAGANNGGTRNEHSSRRSRKKRGTRSHDALERTQGPDGQAVPPEAYVNLRRRAKKFKRRVKMLEARTRERNDHHMRLVSRQCEMEKRTKEMQAERDDLQSRLSSHDRDMEDLELDLVRAQRQVENLDKLLSSSRQDAAQLRSDKANMEREMVRMRERFRTALEEASTQGMAEVRELLDEHPKLVEENRRLKMQLNGVKHSTNEKRTLQRTANAARVAKEMRNLVSQQEEADKRRARQRKEEEKKRAVSKMSKKVSAQAARISRASKKAVARQRSANDALGRASASASASTTHSSSRAAVGRGMNQTNHPSSSSASGVASRQPSEGTTKRKRPRPPRAESDDSDDEPAHDIVGPISVQMSSSAVNRSRWNGSRNENEMYPLGFYTNVGPLPSLSRSEQSLATSSSTFRPTPHQANAGGASTGLALIGNTNALRRSNSITSNTSSRGNSSSNRSAGANRASSSRRTGNADIRRMFGRK